MTIPGFYDEVVPPTAGEMKQFLSSGFQVDRFKKAYGFRSIRTTNRAELIQRIWAAPTFEVHGLVGGYTGPGVKTVVPPFGELKVSMRLVPNQHPAKIFSRLKAHLKKQNPDILVEADGQLEPFCGVTQGPYAQALRQAVQAGFGKNPVTGPGRGIDRRRVSDGTDVEGAHSLFRLESARARLPCPE